MEKRKTQSPTVEQRKRIGMRCVNCGSTENLHYHHIVPLWSGGNDVESNMCCLCADCHSMIHFGEKGHMAYNDVISAGMQAAKKRGVKLGRKPCDQEKIIKAICEHSTIFAGGDWTEPEIMRELNIKNTTFFKYKRILMSELNSDEWNHDFDKPVLARKTPLYEHYIKKCRGDGTIDDVLAYANRINGSVDYGTEY